MAKAVEFLRDSLATPLGEMMIVADRSGHLCGIDWVDHVARLERLLSLRWGAVTLVAHADPHGFTTTLQAYFAGDLHIIDSLPVNPGGTAFQREVWQALRTIPCGTTLSYGALAAQIESACGVEHGWMSVLHGELAPTSAQQQFESLARKAWQGGNAKTRRELMRLAKNGFVPIPHV